MMASLESFGHMATRALPRPPLAPPPLLLPTLSQPPPKSLPPPPLPNPMEDALLLQPTLLLEALLPPLLCVRCLVSKTPSSTEPAPTPWLAADAGSRPLQPPESRRSSDAHPAAGTSPLQGRCWSPEDRRCVLLLDLTINDMGPFNCVATCLLSRFSTPGRSYGRR